MVNTLAVALHRFKAMKRNLRNKESAASVLVATISLSPDINLILLISGPSCSKHR